MSTNRFDNQWLAFKGTTTGWDGSLVAGSDNDVPMPIAVATASGVTINAPAANITIAGVAPSVAAGKSISVPAANITLAGVAPSIRVGASVAIPAANIAIAAVAPSVSAGKSIAVPAVDVAIAALAPTVSAGAGVGVTVDVPSVDIAVAAVAPVIQTTSVTSEEIGSGAGWNIDFTGIETRIAEEKSDREDRRKTIEAVYRRATGQALPDSKPVEVAAAEALPNVKPAARKRMQAELRAIAEIDASIDRLERQIESADMAYLLAEERDIVWIVSEYL